jgi:glycine betaine/proline transport system substrate-binding protein
MGLRATAILVAASACSILAASCGSSASKAGAGGSTSVRLVQNPWDASQLDVAIAQILLTEQMGMTVQVTPLTENAMWPSFVNGDQDACLEVWPSGHPSDIQTYIAPGEIQNGGNLGPVGKISWYVPTYLLTANPELENWQAYTDPNVTAAFATPETGTKGRFLSGDPSWTSYDAQIIKNLGMNLQIVYAGSEDTELQTLDEVYQRRGAILLYLWSPHAALAKYELSPVVLPPYSAKCYATAASGGVACDYPPDTLFKIFWPGLESANPRAYQFLRSFTFTTEDQITLLNLVDNQQYQINQAARWWITTHEASWKAWIPQ